MSQLLEDVKMIQAATGCSLTEAKDAYDRASCDIDLAIELVKEKKPTPIKQEEKPIFSTPKPANNNYTSSTSPVRNNRILEAINREEPLEKIEERYKKTRIWLVTSLTLFIIFSVLVLCLYFLVMRETAFLVSGVVFLVLVPFQIISLSRIKKQFERIIYLVKKYPGVGSGKIKQVILTRGAYASIEEIEKEVQALSGNAEPDLTEPLIEIYAKDPSGKTPVGSSYTPRKKPTALIVLAVLFVVVLSIGLPLMVYNMVMSSSGGDSGSMFSSIGSLLSGSGTSSTKNKSNPPSTVEIQQGATKAKEEAVKDFGYSSISELNNNGFTVTVNDYFTSSDETSIYYMVYVSKNINIVYYFKYYRSSTSIVSIEENTYTREKQKAAAAAAAANSSTSSNSSSQSGTSLGFKESEAKEAITNYVKNRIEIYYLKVTSVQKITIATKSKTSKGWNTTGTMVLILSDGSFYECKYKAEGEYYDDGSYKCTWWEIV